MAVCQATFGHLGEGAPSRLHRQLRQKLKTLKDQTIEAKRRYNKAIRELHNEKQQQRNRHI